MTINEQYDELEELADRWERRAKDTPQTPAGRAAAKERQRCAEELRELIRGLTTKPPSEWPLEPK
jgi:predicted RNA-binding Zn ribbon-like protein